MRKAMLLLAALLAMGSFTLSDAHGHCQIPCGIYDDAARVNRLYEDARTMKKSMEMIEELAGKTDAQSANQLTRWIMNKDAHASNIITTVAEYFLAQRVKPVDRDDSDVYEDYLRTLADHHRVMIAAMKAKQNVGIEYVDAVGEAIEDLARHYSADNHH